jgi:class 3 adenylate cyclase/tetratricopeptide (TPR) repeat protein
MENFGADDRSHSRDAESHFSTLIKFDIVNSTGLWRRLSRPDLHALVAGFRAAVTRVIAAYRVTIEWEGDGALIAFGLPEVRVDAAEAAVRTALELVDAVRAVRAVAGVGLELRVGVASGPVTIDLQTGALAGMAIIKAERLSASAQPGQVLVADDTRRLVRNFFEYADAGMVHLKGFEEETRVWRVVRATALVSRFAAQRLEDVRSAMVGREGALSRLAAAWAEALDGRGKAVCLVGDAGIGKSRLARATLERAMSDGAHVLEIDCTPAAGNTPLLPIGVLLRRTAGIDAASSEDAKEEAASRLLTRLLGEQNGRDALKYLAPLFGIASVAVPLEKTGEQIQAATIATIVAIVRALGTHEPLALLCEDLHWADDTTAQAVQAVAQVIAELRALMIVTRWPRAVTQIDLEAVTGTFTTFPVEPLPMSIAADLVRSASGDGLSASRIETIVGRCGGVPLLLEEVTRNSLEQSDDAAIGSAQAPGSSVPPELQLVVESRLGRWPQFKGIIEAASVLGRDFPLPLLDAMVPGQRSEVVEALSVFADHGLFAQPGASGEGRAGFRHGLIRDAVYETLVSKDYLRWLHSHAADALLELYAGTPDASPDVLAQHLCRAERLHEALGIRLAAAEDTFKRGAYVEATGHCEAAEALIDDLGDRAEADARVKGEAFRLCVLRGMVGAGVHGYSAEPVAVAYRRAQAMFDEATAAESRYPVMRGLATVHLVRGDLPTAFRYSQEALQLAELSGRADYRIDAMSVLAYTTFYFGRLGDCRSWIDKCLALYDAERGDRFRYPVPQDAKTAALALLPTAAWLLGDAHGAEAAIQRGLEHVDLLGRDFDKALLHAWIAGTRYTQRRYLEALNHAGIAFTLGSEQKFQEWEAVGGMMALLSKSALQPAADEVARAVAAGQALHAKGIGLNASYFLCGIARGLSRAGDLDGARAVLGLAIGAAAASQETRLNPEIWMLEAEIEPDPARALTLLAQAFALAETQGAVANSLRAAAAIILRTGDADSQALAHATLDRLDGRSSSANETPTWMQDELVDARQRLRVCQPSALGDVAASVSTSA